MANIIQQLEDLKEWAQDPTRYAARLKFRSIIPSMEAQIVPEEFDELSPREEEYYKQEPFRTREDFLGAKGGVAQLVQPGPEGVRQGYRGKTFGSGTGMKTIDDPKIIKQAENILKELVEKKHGYKVLDWSEKATHPKLKNIPIKARGTLNDLIIKIANKNGWLDGTQYKNTMVVETFMDEYARNGYFTGNEKTSDLLKEFRKTHPDRKFQEINRIFKDWKNGNIVVEGYNINNLEKGTLEALDDWSPKMVSERSINKTNELKYLDELNNQKLSLNQAQAKFRRKFPDAAKNAFWHRVDQLYQLKMEGKIPSGRSTFKTHDIVKGERSDWLKKGLTHNKAGNYNKLLLAADELDAAGKTKQATRLRNAAIKYFSPNGGILAKVPGQAEHPWFRTHGGTSGQLKIDSLVRGDLNTFKNLNFEAPIEKLRKEYVGASSARKAEIKKLIQNRQTFMDELTGGMTKNVKFNFTPNEVKITNLTKPIDTLTLKELGQLSSKGTAFETSALSKAENLGLITGQGTLIKKQVSDKNIIKLTKMIKQLGCGLHSGGRVAFANAGKVDCFGKGLEKIKTGNIATKGDAAVMKKIVQAGAKRGAAKTALLWLGPLGIGGDVLFEAGDIAAQMLGGKPLDEALRNNWITGMFTEGTEKEARDIKVFKDTGPGAKRYVEGSDAYNKLQSMYKVLDVMKQKQSGSRGKITDADIKKQEQDIEAQKRYVIMLDKKESAFIGGAGEEEYRKASDELADKRTAGSYATAQRLKYREDPPTSDRYKSMNIDISLPPAMPKEKQFDTVDKMADAFIDDDEWNYYKDKGFTDKTDLFVEKRKQIPEFNEQVWHNIMNYGDPDIKGTQDSFFGGTYDRVPEGPHFAGGGIANVRRPNAIPPLSGPMPQGGGLSTMFNRVKPW